MATMTNGGPVIAFHIRTMQAPEEAGDRGGWRAVVADDDALARRTINHVLREAGIIVVAEAIDGREAVELARYHEPDLVVMDIVMPGVDGIAATRQVLASVDAVRVVVLTTFEQDDYIFGALSAGASGFLLKRTRPEDLVAGVRTIASGEALLSPSVTSRVIERLARQPLAGGADPRIETLTPREREVLGLLARGLANSEIAAELVIEESTVKTHVNRILSKLDARDRVQAVIFAYENGLTGQP